MALNLGELSIALELDNDRVRSGLAETKRELQTLPPAAQREMVRVSRVMEDEGRKSGGKLAQGINQGLIRNSPLIVAAIGGALAAGAPLMTVAAGTLFAGIGGAAAAQTAEVRQAWTKMGRDVRDGAVRDASLLVPVYVQMADQIGAAFQRMRPQLRSAFADSAPLIRSTTDGVIALAENAMPGLVRAVATAGPVFDGFESFLASTGQGLTDFFDAMSGHAPAAGAAFAALGDIMGDLLPILGELLGQGAELAANVLPAVTAMTGLTVNGLQLLGPLLPPIVTGFVAFKAAQLAASHLQTFSQQLAFASFAGVPFAGATAKASGAVAALGKALPALGIGLGVVTAVVSENQRKVEDWAQAILDGGKAAETAALQARTAASGFNEFIDSMQFGDQTSPFEQMFGADDEDRFKEAKKRADELFAAMSPLQQAQQNVTRATNELSEALEQNGSGSNEAKGAARALESAQAELERQSAATEYAISGVTAAMIDQANQALAAIDSGFAYRNSVDQLEDAQLDLTEAIKNRTNADKDLRTTEEDVARAQLAVEEQAYRTALAFGQQQADLTGLSKDSLEYKRIVQEQMLGELYRLQAAAGPEMAAAIGQQISALQASGVALNGTSASAATTAQRMRDLGLSVVQVPGNKSIFIDAPTADQKRRIEELGLRVMTLPNGRIYVTADTSPAEGTLAAFMNQRRTVQLQAIVSTGAARTTLGGLGGGGGLQRANGGPITGPGSETSDDIPVMASNNEHMWTAREVRAAGGHGAVEALRRAVLSGRGYAAGGAVTRDVWPAPVAAAPATNGGSSGLLHIENYHEAPGSSPYATAQALMIESRTRGGR